MVDVCRIGDRRNGLCCSSVRASAVECGVAGGRDRGDRRGDGGDMCSRAVASARDARRASAVGDVGQGDGHDVDPRRPAELRACATGSGDHPGDGAGGRGASSSLRRRRRRRSRARMGGIAAGPARACPGEYPRTSRRRSECCEIGGVGGADDARASSSVAAGSRCRAVNAAAELGAGAER